FASLAGSGCGAKKEVEAPKVPALRFAGVDVEYALQRIATEAGWVLCLDEASPKDKAPDLALVRIDTDFPAGTLDETMRRLRDLVGMFSYTLENGVLYVRSNELAKDKTTLDAPMLKGGRFKGELAELIPAIMREHPTAFIHLQQISGGFAGPPTEMDIPKNASVKDALLLYARSAKAGWLIHRTAEFTRDATGAPAIVGTTTEPRGPRRTTSRVPIVYNRMSGISALADASIRTNTPFVVYERSLLQDTRGILNFGINTDPKEPLERTFKLLGESGFGP